MHDRLGFPERFNFRLIMKIFVMLSSTEASLIYSKSSILRGSSSSIQGFDWSTKPKSENESMNRRSSRRIPEYRCQKYTYISNVNGNIQRMKYVMNTSRGNHQPGVHSATDDSSQRIPCTFVEPIEELIEPMLDHVGSGSIVEPVKV